MAALYRPSLVFAHIPKTGGKWVRKALVASGYPFIKDLSDGHAPAPKDSPGKVFTFVRHPAHWLASWWAYCQRYGWMGDGPVPDSFDTSKPYDHMIRHTSQCRSESFPEFVDRIESSRPGYVTEFFRPFMETADYVGHQERLRECLQEAVGGSIVALEPLNVGDGKPKVDRGLVRVVEAVEDMEALGYG